MKKDNDWKVLKGLDLAQAGLNPPSRSLTALMPTHCPPGPGRVQEEDILPLSGMVEVRTSSPRPGVKRLRMCLPPWRADLSLKPMGAQGLEGAICDAGEESPTGAGTPGVTITNNGRTMDLSSEVDACSSRLRLSSLEIGSRNSEGGIGHPSPGPPSSVYSPDMRSPFSPLPRNVNGGPLGIGVFPHKGTAEGMSPHPLATTTTG